MTDKHVDNYWKKIVTVFTLGWIVIYAMRQLVPALGSEIMGAGGLDISTAQYGWISTALLIGYTATQVPGGLIGDKFNNRRILVTVAIIGMGVFAALTGFMATYTMFMVMWFLGGLFQGLYFGPQYSLSSEALPTKRLTMGSAIINSGMSFGISLGMYTPVAVTAVLGEDKWAMSFPVLAVLIILVGILIFFIVKEKAPNLDNNSEGVTVEETEKLKISELFKNKNIVLAFITIFCSIYGFFVIINWLPSYLEAVHNIQGSEIAWITSLVPWASIPGAIILAMISDKMGKRKPVLFVMLPIALISTVAIVLAGETMWILYAALIMYGIFGKNSANPVLLAVVADYAPKVGLATTFGVYNFIGMIGAIFAPVLTGYLVDFFGWNSGFYVAGALTLVAIIAVALMDETVTKNNEAV